ncbi:hypothetical protein F53441_11149 [Fusarium austroafricanum]|uniref:Uncharacterized protein n=1 Tax=Fusarium austroafricanum TaxID=2364996 RepID=A0A8H4K426_9HYPO|nr:hypothetical protein F53441_11149 [Fusarium austroafricanum]
MDLVARSRSWLNKVHDFEGPNNSEAHFAQDTDKGYTSNWKPDNLPAAPIHPSHHQLHHPRNRFLHQEQVPTPSEYLEDDAYSESQDAPSLQTGSGKGNNKKRSRSHLYQDSADDASYDHRFERQARRKTRPDRYDSKDKTSRRKAPIEHEAERSRKKSRSKKRKNRSSLDVMNNFVSGAIPNTRVTMRPNLTAGLFLNGRSSTYGQVADLTFNDMEFIETRGKTGKGNKRTQRKGDEFNHDKDVSSDDGQYSQHHIEPPATTTNNEDQEDQESRSKTSESTTQKLVLKKDRETHDDLGSSKETANTSDSETPETMLKKLIESSIFDGTGILKRVWNKDNLGILPPTHANKSPAYQDKGVMAKSCKNSPMKSNTQPNTTEFAHKDASACVGDSTEGPRSQLLKELPLSTCDTTEAQLLPLPQSLVERDTHEQTVVEQLTQDPGAKSAYVTNSRRQSVSQTSEGGHHYIRCLDQNDQLGHMPASLEADHHWIEQMFHQDNVENIETEPTGLFVHRGCQFNNETIPPPEPYSHQHGVVHNSAFRPLTVPTAYSEIYPPHNETRYDKAPSRQPYNYDDDETIHEFINRIEAEVSSRWDESQQLVGDSIINGTEEYNEDEFLGVHNEPNRLQNINSGHREEMQPSLYDMYVWPHQGPALESQTVPEYWNISGYRQDGHSTGRPHDESGASDVKMAAFWRPNRF